MIASGLTMGGESFIFSPANFSRYYAHKLHPTNIDLMAVEYDLELLKILDSLPTFSPLIVELARSSGVKSR
jgi:hypothetical protein